VSGLRLQEMEYWLAEAKQWKKLRDSSDPFIERIANRSNDLAKTNNLKTIRHYEPPATVVAWTWLHKPPCSQQWAISQASENRSCSGEVGDMVRTFAETWTTFGEDNLPNKFTVQDA
jgi:hypothetical protein